jgi:transcriptional regulator with XRE-family HTH domain
MRHCEMPKLTSMLNCVSDEELKELMANLRAWAWQKHGRQKELAAAMDVTEETVSRWLSGRKRPSLEKFFALRAFLKRQEGQK